MVTNEEMKNLTDEEDSSFERIEDDSQLETSASEDEEEEEQNEEDEAFEVVPDELAQARAEVDRLKKRLRELAAGVMALSGVACIVVLLAMMIFAPPPSSCPNCPTPQKALACPSDTAELRQFVVKDNGQGFGFTFKESFVTQVDHGSPAAAAGLRVGDEFLRVNNLHVEKQDESTIRDRMYSNELGEGVLLKVRANPRGLAKLEAAKHRAYKQGQRDAREVSALAAGCVIGATGVLLLLNRLLSAADEAANTEEKKKKRTEVVNDEEEVKQEVIEEACRVVRAELAELRERNVEQQPPASLAEFKRIIKELNEEREKEALLNM